MDDIKIAFVGDIFPGGVLVNQERICDDKVMDVLMSADLRVGTLECALGPGETDGYSFDEEKMKRPDWRNIIWAPEECAKRLKELHIDVVTLANNHIFDLGEKGLKNTIRLLDELGIMHCGAGANYDEASRPAVVTLKGKRIAFLGYMTYSWRAPHPPTDSRGGINQLYIDCVEKSIIRCKNLFDYVFVMPHWGVEHSFFPTLQDRRFAFRIVNAGATGVVGSHTHSVQPSIMFKNKPICFSLGNFLFPDYYIASNRPVCYPSEDELASIPSVLGYPKFPNQVLKSVWKPDNRIGAISMVTIGKSVNNTMVITKLSDDCIINLYEARRFTSKLSIYSLLIVSPFYFVIMKIRSLFLRVSSFLKKLCPTI